MKTRGEKMREGKDGKMRGGRAGGRGGVQKVKERKKRCFTDVSTV